MEKRLPQCSEDVANASIASVLLYAPSSPLLELNTPVQIFVQTTRFVHFFRQDHKYLAPVEKGIEKHPLFSSGCRFGRLSFVKDLHIRPLDENTMGYSHLFSTAP